MKKYKNGDVAKCIKSWRGEGDYIWGGTAAYKKDEEYTIKWVYENKDGTCMFAVENSYGSPDLLYSDRDPKFSEYFR